MKWSHILDAMLEAKCGQDAWKVINHGIGGNSTADLLVRLKSDALDLAPDMVTLMIGGNDASPSSCISAEQTAENLDSIVQQLTEICPRILMMQYHLIVDPSQPEKAWKHLVTNNDLIADVARRHDCPVLDMDAPMQQAVNAEQPTDDNAYRDFAPWAGTNGFRIKDLVGPDGVHLHYGGEIVVGRTVFHKLVELGWI